GFRVTPIRPDLTPREAEYILDDCEAKAVIVDSSVGENIVELIHCKPAITTKIWIGGNAAGMEDYNSVLASAEPHLFESSRIGIPMFYPSGTTGSPKGVYRTEPISHSAMTTIGEQLKLASNRDQALAVLKLSRSGAFSLSVRLPLVCGVSVRLAEEHEGQAILN